ncbi:MAG: hypothetical protein V4726_07335 [Verrucomicrobiota bacterium]
MSAVSTKLKPKPPEKPATVLKIDLTFDLSAVRGVLDAALGATGPDRRAMHEYMAQFVGRLTTEDLEDEVGTKHKTANALGAEPTHFFAKAAGSVKASGTDDGVTMTMQRAGLSRAFFTYHLRPIRSRLLTIPIKKESYGKRAREFKDLKWRTFTKEDKAAGKTDTAGLVLGRPAEEKGGMFIALFAGTKKATVPQDRKILPSDEEWLKAAGIGLTAYLKAKLSNA